MDEIDDSGQVTVAARAGAEEPELIDLMKEQEFLFSIHGLRPEPHTVSALRYILVDAESQTQVVQDTGIERAFLSNRVSVVLKNREARKTSQELTEVTSLVPIDEAPLIQELIDAIIRKHIKGED